MKQVQLGNQAFEGQNNCYVLGTEPDASLTLVDTGISDAATRDQLESELSAHGIAFEDVERILLTHWHPDHTGLAGEIQAASGCSVHAHAADAGLIEQRPEDLEAMNDRMQRRIAEWGMPTAKQEELLAIVLADEGEGEPSEVTPFEAGDRFDVGSVELEAVHLPGHTEGLSGFAFDGRRGEELFSGDALLPYYTPNVGGADTRVERALAKYLDTLEGIVDRGYERAWPGHRGAIVDPTGRAADIVDHHRERTERVVNVLADHGPADPWTVSAHLFGDLHSIHVLHGPGEAHAHLDHLLEAGVVARSGTEYELVDADADLDALFPDLSGRIRPSYYPVH
ncbi:MBL fold metallo-hydrolase [Halorarius litoreus]|uniref:MBL fold metallo-hydrolase n=1 Tax=Halorarius litoreus TaxID=2962676 RepID=UPI0020CEA318|nr:MBL fold metallo-hydrolase [Halorarius litoreus]